MAKTKQMFEQMREAELNERQERNTNHKDSAELMNDLFRYFGEIFGQNQNEDERRHI